MKLLLHAGSHKTGSTALQHYLSIHRDFLAEQGIIYPRLLEQAHAHHKFFDVVNRDVAEARAILTEVAQGKALILSAESIWRHMCDNEQFVKRLSTTLSDYEVLPVVFLRNPTDYAVSLYQETVMSGNFDGSLTQFVREREFWFDYSRIIRDLSVLGNVTALPYRARSGKAVHTESFTHTASRLLQIDWPEVEAPKVKFVNQSVSTSAVLAKRLLNEEFKRNGASGKTKLANLRVAVEMHDRTWEEPSDLSSGSELQKSVAKLIAYTRSKIFGRTLKTLSPPTGIAAIDQLSDSQPVYEDRLKVYLGGSNTPPSQFLASMQARQILQRNLSTGRTRRGRQQSGTRK